MVVSFEKLVTLAKRRGFIFQGSEIYGGLSGTWDYGPLGVLLKNNIKRAWWETIVSRRADVVGIDAAILMNPRVWEASGHVEAFSDPLVECKACHERFRVDEVKNDLCPSCGAPTLTPPRKFNLLVKTYLGVLEEKAKPTYLRGEITQGVHTNFKNILETTALKLPFGVGQIGKAFRNEITPGDFTFRSREFEQMELQWFIRPDEGEAKRWFDYWREQRLRWYVSLGMKREHLRLRAHRPDERAHYAKDAWDIEYKTAAGWRELEGIHNRGDFDLRRHSQFSGTDLRYFDPERKERFFPWIIETSAGVDRSALFFLLDSFEEVKGSRTKTTKPTKEVEVVLHLHPRLAPVKVAILPLVNRQGMPEVAQRIAHELRHHFEVAFDDRGSIGRRYRRQDEIGTPWCVTVDGQTLKDKTVTVRDRDTMEQERVASVDLVVYFREKLRAPET